jgi:predicted transcriptional regulator/RNase P subunit RPR2
MTDGQPPDALQSKLLGIVQEFKGLNGISAARLAREAKKEPDLVERILKGLEVGGMVRPRKADNLTLWMITVKGEQVLDGHVPETTEPAEQDTENTGITENIEMDIEVPVDMPTAPLPDEPTVWHVCQEVGADGKRCGKRYAKAQGLFMHRQRVHLKTIVSPGPGRRSVKSEDEINRRIIELYPCNRIRLIAKRLGLPKKKIEKRIYELIKQGRLEYKRPRYPQPSVATKEEAISKDSPPGQPSPRKKFVCDKCDPPEDFPSARSIHSHKATVHSPVKYRTCKKCGKVFATPGAKGIHEKTCKGKPPLVQPDIPIGPAIGNPLGEIVSVEGPTEYTPDPFANFAKLLAELNAIPGVRVSISISLGVVQ